MTQGTKEQKDQAAGSSGTSLRSDIERRRKAINAIVESFAKLPVLDDRSPAEVLG